MDILKALRKNSLLSTEYGGGPSLLRGLYEFRILKQRLIEPAAEAEDKENTIHEHVLNLGPFSVSLRGEELFPPSGENYEFLVSFLKVLTLYSNEKDFLIKINEGPKISILKAIPGALPLTIAGQIVDCDVVARGGLQFNVTKFIRDLQAEDEEEEEGY